MRSFLESFWATAVPFINQLTGQVELEPFYKKSVTECSSISLAWLNVRILMWRALRMLMPRLHPAWTLLYWSRPSLGHGHCVEVPHMILMRVPAPDSAEGIACDSKML